MKNNLMANRAACKKPCQRITCHVVIRNRISFKLKYVITSSFDDDSFKCLYHRRKEVIRHFYHRLIVQASSSFKAALYLW